MVAVVDFLGLLPMELVRALGVSVILSGGNAVALALAIATGLTLFR